MTAPGLCPAVASSLERPGPTLRSANAKRRPAGTLASTACWASTAPSYPVHRYPDSRLVHFHGVVFAGRALHRLANPGSEATQVAFLDLHQLPTPLFEPDRPVLADAARVWSGPYLR